MRTLSLIVLLLILALLPMANASGIDLSQINRTIHKEPSYTGKPQYCLLVFGPDAKTRVWLVRDGDTLYVDRNGNGDLTEKGERLVGTHQPDGVKWQIGDIMEADGETRHSDLRVWFNKRGSYILQLRTAAGFRQEVGNERGPLRFADRPQDAPIVHLAGPLTFLLEEYGEKSLRFVPGQEAHFTVLLGTPGVGKGTAAYGYSEQFARPGAVKTVVEAVFPAKDGGEPLRVRNVCCEF
jgi:hypothetical protein